MPDFGWQSIYPACRRALGEQRWQTLAAECGPCLDPEQFPVRLAAVAGTSGLPPYAPELAELELARHKVATSASPLACEPERIEINPSLVVLRNSWRILPLLDALQASAPAEPEEGEEWALIWRDPASDGTRMSEASPADLLALKIVVEDLDPSRVADTAAVTVERVDDLLSVALAKGLLIAPASRLRRDVSASPALADGPERRLVARTFSLQWHITQVCDMHCKHCYDRTRRASVARENGLAVLDDLRDFCAERHVRGHVCFTGGNPLMHPHFMDLYAGAAERGFPTSVLGNPAPRGQVAELVKLQRPRYFQISLEGLREHNDAIRGEGSFDRALAFLKVLRDLGVPSTVMLTLTAQNLGQVLPLAGLLRGRADYFTYNRLSPVGEGADMLMPPADQYAAFVSEYVDAARENPVIGFKDNLINVELHERGLDAFGGCTGFGCGAAFNFLALLADGEVHACRKFPSLLGNAYEHTLAEIYDSELAQRYRAGTAACADCELRPVCGGCLAAVRGIDGDIFSDRDPLCMLKKPTR